MGQQKGLIDVEKAMRSKTKGKKPNPLLLRFLKKIVHQDEINTFISQNPDATGLDFIEKSLGFLNTDLEVEGMEKVPLNGRYVFASNHPLGGLDGMSMGYFLGKLFNGKIKFLSNDLLMNMKPLESLFIPINKHGGQGKEATEYFNSIFESDEEQILIFPAGICSRLQKGKICDLEWKKTFITKAIQYKRDIVPVYFDARNSNFFYALGFLRKKLGIKTNIEMLFLADEMFKNRNKKFKAYIGEPIPWQFFDKSKSPKAWAEYVKNKAYQLKK